MKTIYCLTAIAVVLAIELAFLGVGMMSALVYFITIFLGVEVTEYVTEKEEDKEETI